jgi:hypothetical protein
LARDDQAIEGASSSGSIASGALVRDHHVELSRLCVCRTNIYSTVCALLSSCQCLGTIDYPDFEAHVPDYSTGDAMNTRTLLPTVNAQVQVLRAFRWCFVSSSLLTCSNAAQL